MDFNNIKKESIVRFSLENSHIESKAVDEKKGNSKKIRKILWIVIKFMIFVACVGGFSYQITEFITHFYTYPTVVTLDLQEPDSFVKPAITICYLSPVKRTAFCNNFPEMCEHVKDIKSFCSESPHYCRLGNNMYNFMVPKDPDFRFNKDEKSRKMLDDLIKFTDFGIASQMGYGNDYDGPFYMDSALPCYTLNNRAFSNEEPNTGEFLKHLRKSRMGKSTTVEEVQIQVNELEVFDYASKPGALLSVHSPFEVVDPGSDGVILEPNKKYKVHIRLEENHLLKLPYKTDCRDYEEEWIKNGRTGPRSQQVCVNSCWNEYNLKCFNCSKPLMKRQLQATCVTLVQTSCDLEKAGNIVKECLAACKNACKERKYIYKVQQQPYVNRFKDWDGELARIQVGLVVDEPEILVLAHKPQYLAIELFSYIGGFLGCWLGISIWSSSSSAFEILNRFKAIWKKAKEEETKEDKDLWMN
ncbi:amiloride-sensitive sodium channel subunit gamma isoform X2 [Parasteatoda tepidariorum]|uniref:amiloride-sensitive sodium channel subunit gamma isoform X1 n=1 Tax=Parasteatoda tepidariorum TaxID=114398 RepID=UPI001C71BD4B|nr:uncharacterized protein LOC107442477 [Parasteatoda tepidariorum]